MSATTPNASSHLLADVSAGSATAAPSATTAPATTPRREASWWELLRDGYLVFDRRTLGLTRIFLGFYLIFDLFRRTPDWLAMFSDRGVLPSSVVLAHPQSNGFSIVHAFREPVELWALWGVILATYVLLLVGWKTRVWQVLALIWVTGMNGRVLLIENGGYVVQNLLLLWTMFLPLGDRFSLDALLASLRRRSEATADDLNDRSQLTEPFRFAPYVSIVGLVLCFQIGALYYFNVVHKTGPAWRDGTATHYVMYNDRMATPLVASLRTLIPWPVFIFLAKMVMAFEAAVPFLLFSPLSKAWARRAVVVLMVVMHLGFGSSFVLGPFAWALCTWATIFFTRDDWDLAYRTMRREEREITVLYDPRSAAALLASRVLARLDRFELVWFETATSAKLGWRRFAVRGGDGTIVQGADAVAAIVRALPGGAGFAWLFRSAPIRALVDAALRIAEGRTSRLFGLQVPDRLVVQPQGSAAGRAGRRVRDVLVQLVAAAFFVGALNQAAVELWSIKRRWKIPQPEVTRVLSHKMRFLQGWFMFSPNPVMDDGTIVSDAVTADGRHIDPFSRKAPDFDLLHSKSLRYNQIWSDYFNRMHLPGNRAYRDAMIAYMRRLPERSGRPEDALVSGQVYWVKDMNPKWRTHESWNEQRVLLFSFDRDGRRTDAKSGDNP
jgi:hypothetical protein